MQLFAALIAAQALGTAQCPTVADIHRAEQKADRAIAEVSRDRKFASECRGANGEVNTIKAKCTGRANWIRSDQAARTALAEELRMIERSTQGDCQPRISVPVPTVPSPM
jgi:hypothetical protein